MSAGRMAPGLAPTAVSLGGQIRVGTHRPCAAEGTTSPQATIESKPKQDTPAGQTFSARTS